MENSNPKAELLQDITKKANELVQQQNEKIQIADTPLTAGAGEEFRLPTQETTEPTSETPSEPTAATAEKKEVSKEAAITHAKEWYSGLETITKEEALEFMVKINSAKNPEELITETENKKTELTQRATEVPSGTEALNALVNNRVEQRSGFVPSETAAAPTPEEPAKEIEEKKEEKIEDDPNLIMVTTPGDTLMGNLDKLLEKVPEFQELDEVDKQVVPIYLAQEIESNMSKFGWPEKLNINPIIHAAN